MVYRPSVAQTRVDPEVQPQFSEPSIGGNTRRAARDRIQIGEVEGLETQTVAQGDCQGDWQGTCLQNAPQRLILISLAADRVNGLASLQVDDRYNSEVHSRDDSGT